MRMRREQQRTYPEWCRSLSGLPLRADSQLLTALRAAARENSAAIGGLHAFPKTMHLHAAAVIRLKSTFRHWSCLTYKCTTLRLPVAVHTPFGAFGYTVFSRPVCGSERGNSM